MEKSTRKAIKYLRRYIGHEIIRTEPASVLSWFPTGAPILLVGFTSDGCIRYRRTGISSIILGNDECVLPLHFTDRNWITLKKALRANNNLLNNLLNKWNGENIKIAWKAKDLS